jgi:hypothetical protein
MPQGLRESGNRSLSSLETLLEKGPSRTDHPVVDLARSIETQLQDFPEDTVQIVGWSGRSMKYGLAMTGTLRKRAWTFATKTSQEGNGICGGGKSPKGSGDSGLRPVREARPRIRPKRNPHQTTEAGLFATAH